MDKMAACKGGKWLTAPDARVACGGPMPHVLGRVTPPHPAKTASVRGVGGPRRSTTKPWRVVLDNGLTVLLQANHSAPVVALNMWVKVGSIYEQDAEAGISHVYEHMLFKGTTTRGVGEIAQEIEGAGGDINAFTSFDHTVYHITLASRFLDTGLAVMADALQHSSFDPEELRKEQEVVLEEIKRGEDIPSRKLTEALFATSYQRHPYRRPVIGDEGTVRGLTRAHILSFFRTWYVPNNMTLVVTGDFDPTQIMPRIQAAFQDFPSQRLPTLQIPQEPTQRELRAVILADDIQETLLDVAYHVPGVLHRDSYAIDLLSFIIGGGESSRLYQKVKAEQELVHSIYTYPFLPKDPGLLVIGATLEEERWQDALRGILAEVERVQREGVSTAELDRAKRNLESEFIYQRETVQGQASQLGYFEAVLGDLTFESRYLKALARTTPQDIQRVARTYLTPTNLTVGFFLPLSDGAQVDRERVVETVQAYSSPLKRRRSSRAASERRTHKYQLENGLTLLVRENHAVPLVAMQGVFLGGLWVEDLPHNGVMHFIAEMMTKGTANRRARALAEDIESMAGDLGGFAGRNSFGVAAEVLHRDRGQGLELLADVLRHSTFEPDELEKKRADLLAAIKHDEDDLFKVAFTLCAQRLFPGHPYGLNVIGTSESVSRLSRDDLVRWYRRYALPNNLVLAIVGDVEAEAIRRDVTRLLGSWQAAPVDLPPLGRSIRPVVDGPVFYQRDKEQTHIIVGMRGTSLHHPDRYALRVLEAILASQGGRLFVELREKQSLAYTVTARSLEGLDPFLFFVYIATSPEKTAVALDGIREELRRVREAGVTVEEAERAKRYLVGSYEIELQKNAALAAMLAFDERYGVGHQEFTAYAQEILAVTPAMIQHVARTYLSAAHSAVVIVGPSPSGGVVIEPSAERVES
jgi:zinc protease